MTSSKPWQTWHRFYLGVDGGQSSTTALIAEESGRIIGQGLGGPCNHVSGPEAAAKFNDAIDECVRAACGAAGLDRDTIIFSAACLGFSGGAEDKEASSRALIRSQKYKITHDAEIALSGATAGEPGIIAIAGTGSMAFGRNADARTARAGGWGYIFGDEGGAFDLTRKALRAALRYEEGWGPATSLHSRLLEETGAVSADELLHRFYTPQYPRATVAALASFVDDAAEAGDEVAKSILEEAARQLAAFAEGVYSNLFPLHDCIDVAYIGGVFKSESYRKYFAARISNALGCTVVSPSFTPVAGAVLEALKLDGNPSKLSGYLPFDHESPLRDMLRPK